MRRQSGSGKIKERAYFSFFGACFRGDLNLPPAVDAARLPGEAGKEPFDPGNELRRDPGAIVAPPTSHRAWSKHITTQGQVYQQLAASSLHISSTSGLKLCGPVKGGGGASKRSRRELNIPVCIRRTWGSKPLFPPRKTCTKRPERPLRCATCSSVPHEPVKSNVNRRHVPGKRGWGGGAAFRQWQICKCRIALNQKAY